MRYGRQALDDAALSVLATVRRCEGDGGLIAVSRQAEIAMPFDTEGMKGRAPRETAPPASALSARRCARRSTRPDRSRPGRAAVRRQDLNREAREGSLIDLPWAFGAGREPAAFRRVGGL